MANYSQRYASGDSNTAGAFYFSTVAAVDYAATKVMFSADGDAPVHVSAANPLPVTVSGTVTVGSHAVTNAGTFAVQVDGAALTALQLIDDAIYTDGTGTPSKAMGIAGTDGTNPQIIKTDASGELQVDVLTMPTVAVTGTFWQATQPVSLASVPSHAVTNAGTFPVQVDNTVTVASHAVTNAGTFAVQAAQSGTWTVQPGNTANTTPWLTSDQAATSGGCSIYSSLSTAAVIASAVKASAGQVYGIHVFNNGANEVFLRLYNQTGSPGTGDTVVYRAMIPGNAAGAGFVVGVPPGMAFSTGIGIRVTGAVADNDATALAANEVMVNVLYK
jgi:hypothetical protein